jgi:hypothetical protein
LIFFAAYLARKAFSKPQAHYPFTTVKFSLQGKPMTFSGPILTAMLEDVAA